MVATPVIEVCSVSPLKLLYGTSETTWTILCALCDHFVLGGQLFSECVIFLGMKLNPVYISPYGPYGLVAIKIDSKIGPTQQDLHACISDRTIIAWSHDARKAKFWKMNMTNNSMAPVAINSLWLLNSNQPMQGTTGASTWLEQGNWQNWSILGRDCCSAHERVLVCTRIVHELLPHCTRNGIKKPSLWQAPRR